jgi:hypothetical protein
MHRLGDVPRHVLGPRDIRLDREPRPTRLRDGRRGFIQRRARRIHEDHPGPFLNEAERGRPSDPPSRAGDNDYLALEAVGHQINLRPDGGSVAPSDHKFRRRHGRQRLVGCSATPSTSTAPWRKDDECVGRQSCREATLPRAALEGYGSSRPSARRASASV